MTGLTIILSEYTAGHYSSQTTFKCQKGGRKKGKKEREGGRKGGKLGRKEGRREGERRKNNLLDENLVWKH